MNISNFCPIPLAWAPYFMDFKTPFEALKMGRNLMVTLLDVAEWTEQLPSSIGYGQLAFDLGQPTTSGDEVW
jgi:hypothetical protein